MSRIWKVSMLALLASGLLVASCKKKSGEGDSSKDQKQQESKAEESKESESGEAEKAADESEQAEESDFSQEDYVQAAAALSCIDSKLGDDLENRDKVEKDVLGKYGFDQSSYDKADSKFADKDEVTSEIEGKLEDCDKAHARKLAGLSEEGGEEAKEDEAKAKAKPKPKPTPAYVGSLTGEKSDASGFKRAKLSVTVNKDFSANGDFTGAREKGFRVPLEGKVTEDNRLKLSGTAADGKNNVNVEGSLKSDGTMAEVSGSMWDKKFSTTIKLK